MTELEALRLKILDWLTNGETGLSSKTMASCVAEIECAYNEAPLDPDDFKRCLKLVNRIPEIKTHFDAIAKLSPRWNLIIHHWEEIEACFMAEADGWLTNESLCKPAFKTSALMQRIYKSLTRIE